MQYLLIRADATTRTGTGHIMRCIALAQAWHDLGSEVTFLSHCESDAFRQRIVSEGFGFVSVERPHPDPADLKQVLGVLRDARSGNGRPWIVLDGYHFDTSYQETVRRNGFRLLVIDDYNHQSHYHADILLNQNIGAQRLQYACDCDTVLLLETEYALLRREFQVQNRQKREQPVIARKFLVTLGGADPENVTLMVVRALKRVDVRDLEVKIVVGPGNLHWKTLEKEIQKDRGTAAAFQIVRNGDMPELMAWAEMAVSAGGSTCWELAFMGIPFLVIIVSENQEGIAEGLAKVGAAINCGWFHDLTEERIIQDILALCGDNKAREELIKKGQQLVDGHGAERTLREMISM